MSKKIQIIGGSGFVGSRLISVLDVKECKNLDKNKSPFYNSITTIGDIRNIDEINIHQDTEMVILLAAEHRDDVSPSSLYYDVNVNGTKNVLKKMDSLGIKNIIFTSSVAVYGLNKNNPNELSAVDPFNHYGKSKLMAEELIKKWYDKKPNGKSVSIIRPTVIFGERNRGNVYNLLKQISSGKFLMIGRGENKKSMAYVLNVVCFIKYLIKSKKRGFEIFNYVDKPDYNMKDLVSIIEEKMKIKILNIKIPYWLGVLGGFGFDLMAKITRKKLSISSVRVKKFCATTQFDGAKANNIFKPDFTLKQGLNNTLEHEFLNPKSDDILFYSE